MPKYQVRIIETAVYVIAVEADTPEAADHLANEMFGECPDINAFFDSVDDRHTDLVLEVDENGLPV